MESKDLGVFELYLVYRGLLTENQRQTVMDYYGADLSLSEIAELRGISKQAVKCTLDRTEKQLLFYEDTLKLYEKKHSLLSLDFSASKEEIRKRIVSVLEEG